MISGNKFDKKFFSSGVYQNYRALLDSWVGQVSSRIFKILDNKKDAKILDVGCGFGTLLAVMQEEYNFEVAGIECSDYAIKKAHFSVRKKIKKGSILNIPFKKNSFDVVVCFDVVEYLDAKETIKAIRNLIDVSNKYIFFSSLFRHSKENSQKYNPDPLRQPVLSKKEYINLFSKCGARLVDHFYTENSEDLLIFKKK
jgi:2-polyprenyl-3-methyl-5-hydroxy-6-metoxy-1,4-benzoquinol methylase